MLSAFGIKGFGFNIDWGCILFGVKYSPAEECVEMAEGEDDILMESEIVFFFLGPFSVLVIF